MKDKLIFGMYAIGIVAGLQVFAWYMGLNGRIFAFTSLCIGATVGALLGFKWSVNK
jgi:hypothetical protein